MKSAVNCLKVLMTSILSTTFKIVIMVESIQNAASLKTGNGFRGNQIEKFNQLMQMENEWTKRLVFWNKSI